MSLREAGDDAVIDNCPGGVGHQGVARAPDGLLDMAGDVQAVEKFGGLGPAYLDLAQGRDVDDADLVAHARDLGGDGACGSGWPAVMAWPQPRTRHHDTRAKLEMAAVHGGATDNGSNDRPARTPKDSPVQGGRKVVVPNSSGARSRACAATRMALTFE